MIQKHDSMLLILIKDDQIEINSKRSELYNENDKQIYQIGK